MRIECPACATAYEVPPDRLAPGQVVRCARCGSDWTPLQPETPQPLALPSEPGLIPETEPEPAPIAEPEPEPSPEPEPFPPTAQTRTPHKWPLRLAWLLTLLILAAALASAYQARDRIMQAWPPSTRAYTALGLAPNH